MSTDVVMPQMGESIAEGTIVRWIKKPSSLKDDALMPETPLTDDEVHKLASFVAGVALAPEEPKKMPARLPVLARPGQRRELVAVERPPRGGAVLIGEVEVAVVHDRPGQQQDVRLRRAEVLARRGVQADARRVHGEQDEPHHRSAAHARG